MADAELQQVFQSFCSFGAGVGGAHEMDNAKFAKFARDTKLVGGKLDGTRVDMIFTAKKPKGGRKIGFAEFMECLREMAKVKFGDGDEAFGKLRAHVLAHGGPKATGVTVPDNDAALQRQTDTSLYTGAHKERFDADGKGRGKEGREQATGGLDLHQVLDRSEADVRGVNVAHKK